MKKRNKFYLQLDYFTKYGKERTRYFSSKSSLLRFIEDSGFFVISVYDFNKHDYIFKSSESDLFIKKFLIYLSKFDKE